ncbi:glycosyltransferase [Acinetobacter schindleri]|nr:glycosyltransferase [Acinetobacter schindleri]
MSCLMEDRNYLFVSPTAVLGGAERVMFNLMLNLLEKGNTVIFFSMTKGKQPGWDQLLNYENFIVYFGEYSSEKKSLIPSIKFIYKLTRKYNVFLAFSSHTHINGLLSLMRKLKVFKFNYLVGRESTIIFERYYGIWRIIFKLIYKFAYGSQDLLICQTEKMKVSLINSLGCLPVNNVEVLFNPVNLSYIDNQLKNTEIVEKPFNTLIVACGRLIPLKKFDYLIAAFATISSTFPQAGLIIIGDGSERNKLITLIDTLNIRDKVHFVGKINNPIQWFSYADIGVISSEIEGFPNVLIEMMASGVKQIISTPCSDGINMIPDINITNSCSISAIKDKIEDALKHPANYSLQYKQYIYEHRSAERFWNKVEELIKNN